MASTTMIAVVLAFVVVLLSAPAQAQRASCSTDKDCQGLSATGLGDSKWVCVNSVCAATCSGPGYNQFRGVCSGGDAPFAGVFCNSVVGSGQGILMVDRYNVGGRTLYDPAAKAAYSCSDNAKCNTFGAGYICNNFATAAARGANAPPPTCAKPANTGCFPLVAADCLSKCANWPKSVFPLRR